jgi:Domain of unknown function (DUF427)
VRDAYHSTPGESFTLRTRGRHLTAAAFRPADPDLAGHLVLDFTAFDAWYEEDVRLAGHPRDPYHRVDIRRSSRRVRVELDGRVLAETVRVGLRPSDHRTTCAYKGKASYWSVDGQENLLWAYEHPLEEAVSRSWLLPSRRSWVQG